MSSSGPLPTNLQHLTPDLRRRVLGVTRDPRVEIVRSRSGYPVPVVLTDQKRRPLHSTVAPERESERFFRADPHLSDAGFVVAVGLGAGYHLARLLDGQRLRHLLVVIPDLPLFAAVLAQVDLSAILADPRVRVTLSVPEETIETMLADTYHPLIHGDLRVVPLRSLEHPCPEHFGRALRTVGHIVDGIQIDMSTQATFGARWLRNALFNLPLLAEPAITLPSARRAVITAAGPSLESALPRIAGHRDRGALLIATDTSCPFLARSGVSPDLVVTVDSQLVSYHHYLPSAPSKSISVFALTSSPTVVRASPTRAFVATDHPFASYVAGFPGGPSRIDAGANVTYAAVDIARRLGVEEILLEGADFSYPEGKPYAKDTYLFTHYRSSSIRLRPQLTSLLSMVFRHDVLRSYTESTLTYTPPLMRHYRATVKGLLGSPSPSRRIHSRTHGFDWRGFLREYRRALQDIPDTTGSIESLLSSLTPSVREVASTLFPSSVAGLSGGANPGEALADSRTTALQLVDTVLEEF